MSYLKVKIYFKSRLNFLLLIFFLKWCVLFLIFYEIVKMVSNVSYHIILVKTRKSDAPSHSAFRTDLLEANQSDPLPLILLWNKYQLTGSKVYNTIFERMTAGKCQVGFYSTYPPLSLWAPDIWDHLESVWDHDRQEETEWERRHRVPHARPALGGKQRSNEDNKLKVDLKRKC